MPMLTESPQLIASSPVVVGIAGGSASGKTTLAKYLARGLGGHNATVLAMDRFYLPKVARSAKLAKNYDHPAAIDFGLLENVIRTLRGGNAASVPIYDYASHDRIGCETISASKWLILEGILALWDSQIRSLIDFAVYVDAPDHVRLRRRLERDTRERGRQWQAIESQWTMSVLPMHIQYVAPTKSHADRVIHGDRHVDEAVRSLSRQLERNAVQVS